MKNIKAECIEVVFFEPTIHDNIFFNSWVIQQLVEFKTLSDVILCNRMVAELVDVADKVYTRYLLGGLDNVAADSKRDSWILLP